MSLTRLPIALYPDITPPTIAVSASYPGADAETVAKTVGAPIELQVNGRENAIMSPLSADDGTYSLTVTFALGTDVNIAMVLLQNLVNNVRSLLPQVIAAGKGSAWSPNIPPPSCRSWQPRFPGNGSR